MFDVSEDAIKYLILSLDTQSIVDFFEAYPELSYILEDEYFLGELSIVSKVPTISNLNDLIRYTNMPILKRLVEASSQGDNLNDVIRMLNLVMDELERRLTNESIETRPYLYKVYMTYINKSIILTDNNEIKEYLDKSMLNMKYYYRYLVREANNNRNK